MPTLEKTKNYGWVDNGTNIDNGGTLDVDQKEPCKKKVKVLEQGVDHGQVFRKCGSTTSSSSRL